MNTLSNRLRARAFTLVELLIVISIMAILAAMLFPAGKAIMEKAAKARARTELMKVDSAINAYKNKLGHFPPDNPNNASINPLYFELSGCVRTNLGGADYFMTIDGTAKVGVGALPGALGVDGIVNTTTGAGADEGGLAQAFLKEIKPGQFGETALGSGIRVLGVGIDGPMPPNFTITPFEYNSSTPTNNVNSFDLWVDVKLGGKTNRISNWSTQPQILQ